MKLIGKNKIIEIKIEGITSLCESPYQYRIYRFPPGQVQVELSGKFCIAVLCGVLELGEFTLDEKNQFVLVEGAINSVRVLKEGTQFIIVGLSNSESSGPLRRLDGEMKRVEKPWGYELWVVERHNGFAFKKIYIKAGTKTSLQYHQFKTETNLMYSGRVLLHYAKEKKGGDPIIPESDISNVLIEAGVAIHVDPPTIHRLEAVTDLMCYEASTIELDDVIRITDDTGRPNGFISAEHNGKK